MELCANSTIHLKSYSTISMSFSSQLAIGFRRSCAMYRDLLFNKKELIVVQIFFNEDTKRELGTFMSQKCCSAMKGIRLLILRQKKASKNSISISTTVRNSNKMLSYLSPFSMIVLF